MKWLIPVLWFVLSGAAWAAVPSIGEPLDYALTVSIDPKASTVAGTARMAVEKGREVKVHRGRLNVKSASLNGRRIALPAGHEAFSVVPDRTGTMEMRYEGAFGESTGPGEERSQVIVGGGIFLSGLWYPKPERMCFYRLRVQLPRGFDAVSEAETVAKTAEDGRTLFDFVFPHPLEDISFVATDRYKVVKERFDNVEIFAYFFAEDADLVPTYLAQTKKYLRLYAGLVGPFPYKRFSVVENFLPTGYSMPTYTLLGQQVVRLPFIPQTSLGHEILHQWFGNLVYVDYDKGNWAEGLTTFLADQLFEAQEGRGPEYRKTMLTGYMSYVNDRNEFPLKDFRARSDQASEAIGYGKAAMVFQMLKTMMGDEAFHESIRHFTGELRFRRASWDDIRRAFERYRREDLSPFFHRWIDEKGLADLRVTKAELKTSGRVYEAAFDISQERKGVLYVPVTLYFEGGKTVRLFRLSKERETFSLTTEGLPHRLAIDENYEVARRLSEPEFPPVIARLLGDGQRTVVTSSSRPGDYEGILRDFRMKGDKIATPERATHEDLKTNSVVILGADNPVAEGLLATQRRTAGFTVTVRKNPWNAQKVAAVFDGASKREVDLAFPKIPHYGKYSALSFDEGRNTVKTIEETGQGIGQVLAEREVGVDMSSLKSLPSIVEQAARKRAVYVGETHDRFSHHVVQLEMIKGLYRGGKRIAIGMEMFQRPFQKILDGYIAGRIDEKALLKGTEYFARWGFDYSLYRPILLFARSEKIPVIALNQKSEIIDKVFRSGLESLSDEERRLVPKAMDFGDQAYRDRLRGVFHLHQDLRSATFDFFYQAQVLWDETMAESVDTFLRSHEGYQMIVLAGDGHIAHGSGIPKRVFRRNGLDYTTILNDAEIEMGVADFVIFPGSVPGGKAPLLQVQLRESTGMVMVEGFPERSASKRAGMKAGDRILSIEGVPVRAIEDLKIELLTKTGGDKAKVRISRKGVLGTREMDLEVELQ